VRGYGLDGRGSILSRAKIFLSSVTSRSALGPTQPPIQWVMGALYPGVKLTTHLHLEPRSIMELHLHFPIRLLGVVLN
jgi:hypothetical protein